MLPTANEGPEIIEPAIEAVKNSNYPLNKIIILLALEEREPKEKRDQKEKILREKFGGLFYDFLVTVHKVAPGEMKCKASNTSYAAKELKNIWKRKKSL